MATPSPGNGATSAAQEVEPSGPGDAQDKTVAPATSPGESQASPISPEKEPVDTPVDSEPDLEAIEAEWQSSPHAASYVLDDQGQNNTCARCHAPVDWLPSMDTLPESCFTCKFELQDPPSLIPESEWESIPCHVCHPVDKKKNIQPEYAWLEIPVLGEYVTVASPSELCLKCHAPVDIPRHVSIVVAGAHPDYQCTDCHSAHSTITSCGAVGCHDNTTATLTPVAGHDADHQNVACEACHDGSAMEVDIDEESGLWTTFITVGSGDTQVERFAFISHNIVLEAKCDRCHFVGNPWGLSESETQP